MRCFHEPHRLFGGTFLEWYITKDFAEDVEKYGREDCYRRFLERIREDSALSEILEGLPDGVYLFGHNHIQWHMELNGKLLLNPGACGNPQDGMNTAPYALLEIYPHGRQVEERRCSYDTGETVRRLKASSLYREARVSSELMISDLNAGLDHRNFFKLHVAEYAKRIGDSVRPYTEETWNAAYEDWVSSCRRHEW